MGQSRREPDDAGGEPGRMLRSTVRMYPELRLFPDDEARKAAIRKAMRMSFYSPAVWGLWLVFFAAVMLYAEGSHESLPIRREPGP